jgi:hypothetical protein
MMIILRWVLVLFLCIFALTALLTIVGLIYLWFINPEAKMPYLQWLLGIVIAEVVGTIVIWAKKGVQYLPDIKVNPNSAATNQFMKEFIVHGSSVTIVSNRCAWLIGAMEVQQTIIEKSRLGTYFEIITSQPVDATLQRKLNSAGVRFFVTNDHVAPEARFTLVNAGRSGAERLAIARGTHPNHEITIFDNSSGPQIIALAKDIIRRTKALSDEYG